MKTILQVLLTLSLFGCSQTDPEVFNCEKWKNGDTISYNVELSQIDVDGDSISKFRKNKYSALLVLSGSDDSYTITWHIRHPIRRSDSTLTMMEKLSFDTTRYQEILKIVYKVDELGQYQELINWTELEKYADSLWDSNIGLVRTTKTNEKLVGNLKDAFTNRPGLEAKFTREILALHRIYGQPDTKTMKESKARLSGLNNQSISSTIKSEYLRNQGDNVVMRITQELDPKETANQVNDWISEFISDSITFEMEVRDTTLVDFNRLTNWPRQVEYWRMISVGKKTRQISISLQQII